MGGAFSRRWPCAAALAAAALAANTSSADAPSDAPRLSPARAHWIAARPQAPAVAGFSSAERRELNAGAVVTRPVEWEPSEGIRLVGGVSYAVVNAPPEVVLRVLRDYGRLEQVLPRTRRSAVVQRRGDRTVVELEQGTSLVSATYSVVLERQGSTVRFWMDPTRPHGIEDAWGYFRAEPLDDRRSLVTVAALVDLGPGLARLLFEDRVQRMILGTSDRLRSHVELPRLVKK
jgi:hypothetical protein